MTDTTEASQTLGGNLVEMLEDIEFIGMGLTELRDYFRIRQGKLKEDSKPLLIYFNKPQQL